MKRVATAPFTVSQLIEGPKGDAGDPGSTGPVGPYVFMSKWTDGSSGTKYYAGKSSSDPYKNLVYYSGLWYACILSYTRSNSSAVPASDSTHWSVMQNYRFIASEVIFSERGYMKLMQSQSIIVVDDQNDELVKTVLDKSGLTFYEHDSNGNMTAYMKMSNGTLGYYKANGTAIWQLGAAGVINIFGATSNGWVPKSLYKLGTSAAASQTAAQATTNFAGTTYYVLTSKASSNTKELGYTQKSASTAGAAIDDGYYCSSGPPMETIRETIDDVGLMERTVLHYVGGYLKDSVTVIW